MVQEKKYPEPLEPRVLHFIRENRLLSGRQPLLVAVSGGPDSVCLLHILFRLQEELNLSLHVAHLNHQLRGAEAEADASYVASLAQKMGIPTTIERRDVKAEQARQRTSLEEAAREVRYAFLAQVARSIETDQVAVGHTRDDHVETILMHLIRGTGTRGLRGLSPGSPYPSSDERLTLVRPLLQVTRQDTADYCRRHQLRPRTDTSNLSPSTFRNRVRHQLLPQLESYNPRVIEALLRTARIAGDDLAFLEKEGGRLWNRIARIEGNTIALDKKGFLKIPPALQRQLLRTVIEKLLGSLKDIETRHIEEIMTALNKPAGKRLNLPGGLLFVIEYDRYLFGPEPAALSPFPLLSDEYTLKIPGVTALSGWQVTAAILNPPPASIKKRTEKVEDTSSFTAYLDLDKAGSKVTVRRRRPGDRFQPLGMSQPKKLGEYMIDVKIPRAWRQRVPIVCSPDHILWVVGGQIDERVKVTAGTGGVLHLTFKPVSTAPK